MAHGHECPRVEEETKVSDRTEKMSAGVGGCLALKTTTPMIPLCYAAGVLTENPELSESRVGFMGFSQRSAGLADGHL